MLQVSKKCTLGAQKKFRPMHEKNFHRGIKELRPPMPAIRAFFIRGRNLLFRILFSSNLEGGICPLDLINQRHMPLMPYGIFNIHNYKVHLISIFARIKLRGLVILFIKFKVRKFRKLKMIIFWSFIHATFCSL